MVVKDCFSAGREPCDGCAAVIDSVGEDVARDPCHRRSKAVVTARKAHPCAHTKKRKAKAAAVIPVAAPVTAPAPHAMEVDSGVSLAACAGLLPAGLPLTPLTLLAAAAV